MHHFEADIRFIRVSEEYRMLGGESRHRLDLRVWISGNTLWSAKLAALLFEPLVWPS